MNTQLKPYIPLCDALAALFHPHVEVVLHDLKSKRLVHIANAFSARRAGDAMVGGLEENGCDWVGPYLKSGRDNRELKAVTIILRDDQNHAIGMLCINYDISTAKALHEALGQFVNLPTGPDESNVFFAQNWKAHIDERIEAFLHLKSISLQGLTSSEKRDLVNELDSQGVFAIRNGLNYVANVLGVSRASLYNWLKKERNA
jgi:predicted transcriptional regulator YheO